MYMQNLFPNPLRYILLKNTKNNKKMEEEWNDESGGVRENEGER